MQRTVKSSADAEFKRDVETFSSKFGPQSQEGIRKDMGILRGLTYGIDIPTRLMRLVEGTFYEGEITMSSYAVVSGAAAIMRSTIRIVGDTRTGIVEDFVGMAKKASKLDASLMPKIVSGVNNLMPKVDIDKGEHYDDESVKLLKSAIRVFNLLIAGEEFEMALDIADNIALDSDKTKLLRTISDQEFNGPLTDDELLRMIIIP